MTKVGQTVYRAMTPSEQRKYMTPILPKVPQRYHPDLNADLDTPLTSRYAYDEVVKGSVAPSLHSRCLDSARLRSRMRLGRRLRYTAGGHLTTSRPNQRVLRQRQAE